MTKHRGRGSAEFFPSVQCASASIVTINGKRQTLTGTASLRAVGGQGTSRRYLQPWSSTSCPSFLRANSHLEAHTVTTGLDFSSQQTRGPHALKAPTWDPRKDRAMLRCEHSTAPTVQSRSTSDHHSPSPRWPHQSLPRWTLDCECCL